MALKKWYLDLFSMTKVNPYFTYTEIKTNPFNLNTGFENGNNFCEGICLTCNPILPSLLVICLNSADPDQTVPLGAVWSGSTLFDSGIFVPGLG